MSELTMMDVARLLDSKTEMSDDDVAHVLKYELLVDRVATDVLRSKPDGYVIYLSSLIQSIALQDMIDEGTGAEVVISLAKNPGFVFLMAHVIKTTIGIAILEELR